MPDLGQHAATVLSAYGITAFLLSGLGILTWLQSKRVQRALEAVEEPNT